MPELMRDLFYIAVAMIPFLAFCGIYGAIVDWQVERKRRREVPLKRYPEPKFRERIGGDISDRQINELRGIYENIHE